MVVADTIGTDTTVVDKVAGGSDSAGSGRTTEQIRIRDNDGGSSTYVGRLAIIQDVLNVL